MRRPAVVSDAGRKAERTAMETEAMRCKMRIAPISDPDVTIAMRPGSRAERLIREEDRRNR